MERMYIKMVNNPLAELNRVDKHEEKVAHITYF